ncbi:hypothetical protein AAF712_003387 [Marasmius tenuissimus]|uniref:Uncharacterized protein n=1 Tax=Marasmius tenuissimus TaxID=585030 RepID=A0ABR3A7M4_9AGAR
MPLRTFFSKKTSSSSSTPATGQSFATKSQSSLHLYSSLTPESPTSAEYVDVASALANVPSSPNGRSSLHPNHAYQAQSSVSPKKNSSVYPSIANSPASTASASSGRLRLFGRKKGRSTQSVKSTEEDSSSPLPLPPSLPRPSFAGALSDTEIPLVPPKLGMALGGGASTRSLPNTNPGRPELRALNTVPTPKPLPLLDDADLTVSPISIVTEPTNISHGLEREKEKKKSLFSWSKTESKASGEKTKKGGVKGKERDDSSGLTAEESFNLKSFRHVQPSPSPSRSPVNSPGASPNPSFNSPYPNAQSFYSVSQTSQPHLGSPNASTSLAPPPPLNHPTARPRNGSSDSQAQRISVAAFREAQARRSMAGSPVFDGRVSPGPGVAPGMKSRSQLNLNSRRISQTFTSEDESSEEEEEEDDSDDDGPRLSRKRTVTNRTYSGARSESGHGAMSQRSQPTRGKTKSELGHGSSYAAPSVQRPNPAIPLPSQAPQRAQAANDSDSDEDNTPLGSLLPPRRPGSALSSRSNSSLNGRVPPSSFTPPPQERTRTMSTLSSYNPTPSNLQSSNAPPLPSSYSASGHSEDSSTTSRPAPLIDINKLTGPNRAPLQSGAKDTRPSPTKSKAGFTGGDTLLSGGNGRKRTRSPEKRQGATSPTMSMYSTTAPANKKFVSPPSSPRGSVFSLGASSAIGGGGKPVAKRQETVMSDASSVGSGSAASGGGGGQRRDRISERLKGVVQGKMTGAPSPVSTSAPPLPVPAKVPTSQSSRSHLRSPAAFDDSDSDEDEEEEEEDESDDDARYGAADGTIKGRQQQAVRAASSPSLPAAPAARKFSPSPSPTPSSQRLAPSRSPVPQSSTPPPPSATSTTTSFSTQASQPPKTTPRRPQPAIIQPRRESVSAEPDVDLADVLGGGIRLISFDDDDGVVFPPSPVDLSDPHQAKDETEQQQDDSSPYGIAPIVVRERERTPAFSVTSRPRHKPGSASVSGVISLGSSSTMEQGKADDADESVTTSAIASQWGRSTTSTTMATGGRARSSSIGSLPLLTSATMVTSTTTTTTTTAATKPPVLKIPPPRTSSLSPESKTSMSSFEETLSQQSRAQPPLSKEKGRSRGFGVNLLQNSKSSSALGSNDSAASGSSSISGGSSAVGSSSSGSSRPQRQQAFSVEKEKSRPSKHSRGASAGGMSNISGSTMRAQPQHMQSQTPPSGASSSASSQMSRQKMAPAMKPFSGLPPPMSRGSPATSSTGGSSTGRAPVTPRDGSELGIRGGGKRDEHQPRREWSGGASGLGFGHGRKKSATADDEDIDGTVRGKSKEEGSEESRRRDRRRGEAKAAIELGNFINGKGPVVDDDDEDMPIGGQYPSAGNQMNMNMNMMNPMMMMPPNGGFPAPFGWNPTGGSQLQLPSPSQFMVPPPTDPSFFTAHQQAMMYAKQAYQMAVAQQAMAAAAEEWERGSAVGGFSSSQSMYGGFGPATTGSVYGGFGGGNGWSTGSVMFPQGGSRTPGYGGFSGAKSEYGGGGGGRATSSVYGGSSYGPQERARTQSTMNPSNRMSMMSQRDSMMLNMPPPPPIPQQKTGPTGRSGGPATGGTRNRTVSQPASPANNRNARPGKHGPPSSWKPGM